MNATKLLAVQHGEMDELFGDLERATGEERVKLFEQLARNLVAHDAIEREIFYPACEKRMGTSDLLADALVKHGVVEFCLYLAHRARDPRDFAHKLEVLREIVEHHVEEEQNELFPAVEAAFTEDALEALGEVMEARFERARKRDFRLTLRDDLRQMLAGVLEAEPSRNPERGRNDGKNRVAGRANARG